MKKLIIGLILILIIAIGIFFFARTPNTSTDNASSKLKVAASFAPVADLVKQVGGDKVELVQILPSGSSPHTYEPIARDQDQLIGIKLAFIIGHDLDFWAEGMVTATNPKAQLVPLDQDIDLLESNVQEAPGQDPHYWLAYGNVQQIVRTINSALADVDPNNREYYQQNADAYINKLETAKIAALAKIKPLTKKQFVSFHPAFAYFAKELGLEVVASIEKFPGIDPSPEDLIELKGLVKQYRITTLFKEPEFPDALVSDLAKDYGTKVDTLDPEGGLDNTTTFLDMMSYNIDIIVKALK